MHNCSVCKPETGAAKQIICPETIPDVLALSMACSKSPGEYLTPLMITMSVVLSKSVGTKESV
jgi:hypothetical protein